ncbi:DUF2577 family protein [Sporosarcina newyorkensis]|uniref:DUF2577 domain-containing protein n=1 Tax=Sporosarcina newyorkensis TaxID=759851 RepID=A0A1T4XI29_9BACL|nr:DUF2577 family protein [Sporosarcina newyorkensis]SKA88765.1 Protein of unknown function [Sporosarcina newyorkensis]
MQRRIGLEGNTYSKFTQLIREVGYSKPVNIEIATVIDGEPNVRIKLDHDGLELEKEELIIAKHLTQHERNSQIECATIDGSTKPGGTGPHTHGYETITMRDAKITVDSLLVPGTRVLVACLEEDMVYVVLDEAVWF